MFGILTTAAIGFVLLFIFLYMRFREKWRSPKSGPVYLVMLLLSGLLIGGGLGALLDRIGVSIANASGKAASNFFDVSRVAFMLVITFFIVMELRRAIKAKRAPTWVLGIAFIAPAVIIAGGGPVASGVEFVRTTATNMFG